MLTPSPPQPPSVSEGVPEISTESLNEIFEMMKGSYTSNAQSIADTTYYDISLHMYPIWNSKDGKYLYVEQALTEAQERPYRQRVYALSQLEDGRIASKVYSLDNPESLIGKWKTPEYFDSIDLSILKEREGCTVYLNQKKDGSFSGSTQDDECKSTLRGATYATSVVTVFSDKIMSWDQGFDSEGKQVWGATEGGYIFDKINID